MKNLFIAVIVSCLLGGCTSQQFFSATGHLIKNSLDKPDPLLAYDDEKIFPSPNQRLACEMDWSCDKPLSEREWLELNEEEMLLVIYGDNSK